MSDSFSFQHTIEDGKGDILNTVSMSIYGNAMTHMDVTERFAEFLRGCGYVIGAKKRLGWVDDK